MCAGRILLDVIMACNQIPLKIIGADIMRRINAVLEWILLDYNSYNWMMCRMLLLLLLMMMMYIDWLLYSAVVLTDNSNDDRRIIRNAV